MRNLKRTLHYFIYLNKYLTEVYITSNCICMWIMAFWIMTPYCLVGGYQRFGGTIDFIFRVEVKMERR
jgi:hypothetical protein